MINFLKETIDALAAIGRTPADVISIGDSKYRIDWDTFAANADFEYDNGFGGPYICGHTEEKGCDFVVYGIGFVMYRHEYDGAEYWYSIEIPDDVSPNIKPKRVRFHNDEELWDSHFRWQFELDKNKEKEHET